MIFKKIAHFLLGRQGEDAGCRFLVRQGYKIVEKNYRCPLGEIDVVARKGRKTAFIEIKTRRSHHFGVPEEAVERHKQRKIIQVAKWYLKEKKQTDSSVQFDVLAVTMPEGSGSADFKLIENAFIEESWL